MCKILQFPSKKNQLETDAEAVRSLIDQAIDYWGRGIITPLSVELIKDGAILTLRGRGKLVKVTMEILNK
jgi:hypothetical protein